MNLAHLSLLAAVAGGGLSGQVVLLRNRDRLSLLWPPVLDHLSAIIRGKGVEGALVAAAAVGLLRLCQRLLPCKPEAAEPLLRGLQLVPGLDPEVGRPTG